MKRPIFALALILIICACTPAGTISPEATAVVGPSFAVTATPIGSITRTATATITPAPTATGTAAPVPPTPTLTPVPPKATPVLPTDTAVPATVAVTNTPAGETGQGVCDCSSNIYNCSDFSTRAEAQDCLQHCLAQVGYDVHVLDRDEDGIACESLP